MKQAIMKIQDIQNATGLKQKQAIVLANKENELFRKILYYALNPLLTYKVSEQTLNGVYPGSWETTPYNDIFEICKTLSSRKAVDDYTLRQVGSFLRVQSEDIREFYIKLLSKTLRLGITSRTIEKIIPDIIPVWDVQQAYPVEKYPIKEGAWFALSQKLNGVRATYYRGQLFARSGIPFEGLDHITEQLTSWVEDRMVLDGELTLRTSEGISDNEAFRVATGIINSDGDKSSIGFTIFDSLPTEEFEAGESKESFSERRKLYLDSFESLFPTDEPVRILPILYKGTDQAKITELLDVMVKEDKEGLMLNLDTTYKCKRHKGILKVKRFYTMDLPIVRCEKGDGRLRGTLGAVVVDFKGNEVNVGSGFSDEQRAWIWEHRDEIIGRLCEVKYKEISEDKSTGLSSLQFPVFVSLRKDKDVPNYE